MIKPKIRFDNNYPEWAVVKVEDIIDYERPDKYIVKSDIYCGFGVPVLTANKSFILGFTDESEGVSTKGRVQLFSMTLLVIQNT